MSNELSDLILTIDTREKNRVRIDAVKTWFETLGGFVELGTLKLCDYHIQGTFRDKEISLGIEAKSLPDFATSYGELPDKLARSYELYSEVALFIETGNYSFTSGDGFKAVIKNPSVYNQAADILPLAILENMSESLTLHGIHVRHLRSEYHFPYAIGSLLVYICHDVHSGLHIDSDNDYNSEYHNVLAKIPCIGFKRALKISEAFPDLYTLCSVAEEHLQDVLGKKTGHDVYRFLRYHCYPGEAFSKRSESISTSSSDNQGGSSSFQPPCSRSLSTEQDRRLEPRGKQNNCVLSGEATPDTEKLGTHDTSSHTGSELVSSPTSSPLPDDNGERNIKSPSDSLPSLSPSPCNREIPSLTKDEDHSKASKVPPESPGYHIGDLSYLNDHKPTFTEVSQSKISQTRKHMSIIDRLKSYMADGKPRTMQEIVDAHSEFSPATIFDSVMAGVKGGSVKKITEQTGRITFQRTT